jgi:hypothetical protein
MFLRSRMYSSCKISGNMLKSGREPMKLLFDRSNTVNFDALLKYIRYVWFVNRFELKFLRTTKLLMWLGKNHNDNIETKHQWAIKRNKENSKIYILSSLKRIRKMFSRIGGKNN